jgi:hypothetical protein
MRTGSRSLALAYVLLVSGAAACGAFSSADPETGGGGETADAGADVASDAASGFDTGAAADAGTDATSLAGVVAMEGFESSLDCPGWALNGVTAVHDATTVHSGSSACKVCLDGTAGDMLRTLPAPQAVTHQVEVWVRGDALSFAVDAWFVAEAGIEGYLTSNGKTPKAATWTKVVTSTTPSVGSTLFYRFDFNGVANQCVYVDDLVVRTQ